MSAAVQFHFFDLLDFPLKIGDDLLFTNPFVAFAHLGKKSDIVNAELFTDFL